MSAYCDAVWFEGKRNLPSMQLNACNVSHRPISPTNPREDPVLATSKPPSRCSPPSNLFHLAQLLLQHRLELSEVLSRKKRICHIAVFHKYPLAYYFLQLLSPTIFNKSLLPFVIPQDVYPVIFICSVSRDEQVYKSAKALFIALPS